MKSPHVKAAIEMRQFLLHAPQALVDNAGANQYEEPALDRANPFANTDHPNRYGQSLAWLCAERFQVPRADGHAYGPRHTDQV